MDLSIGERKFLKASFFLYCWRGGRGLILPQLYLLGKSMRDSALNFNWPRWLTVGGLIFGD